eukprot:6466889-Amphidinium_carterae.1
MGWICHATNLHAACVVDSREPDHLLKMFTQMWLSPFGYPSEVWTDYDGGFRGIFSEHLTSNAGILVKLTDQLAATTVEDVKQILPAALHGKNTGVHRSGHSAFAAAFGRQPRLPGALLDDRNEAQGRLLGPRDAEYVRLSAMQALLQVEQIEAIRASQLRRGPRQDNHIYHP